MPRIFNYGDIPKISFTPDKELNILIYSLPSYLIIYRSHILIKWSDFLAHPVHFRSRCGYEVELDMYYVMRIKQ